jgi:tetratricopeptide (TPR) repeat protein
MAVVPRQLRRSVGRFVNRVDELALITSGVDAGAIVGLSGPGGVGKSELALRWLHASLERFPDGQLCADLGGSGRPVDPDEVLGELLRGLGVPPESLPASYEGRYGLFLTLTADRRLVLFLENAVSAAQVRQLRPAEGVAVLVTSRAGLTGLRVDGPFLEVPVRALAEQPAVELLQPGDGQASGARRLARLCGGFPLALSIVGAMLALRPFLSMDQLAEELHDGRERVARLAVPGDVSLQASFDMTYEALPPAAARLYRAMGLHPTAEFGVEVAAVAAVVDEREAEALLRTLAGHRLLEEVADRRFRFHDLLWLHAGQRAAAEDDPADRVEVVRRVLGWYADRAAAADLAVQPSRWRVGVRDATPFPGRGVAWAWLRRERANLAAAVLLADGPAGAADRAWVDAAAWRLAMALWPLYFTDRLFEDWLATHTTGIEAARRLGDDLAVAKLCCQRGFAHLGQERTAEAAEDFRAGLRAAEAVGDGKARVTATESLGLALLAGRRFHEALETFDAAGRLGAELTPRAAALLRHHRARALTGCGRAAEALAELDAARAAMREAGDRYNEGRVLTSRAAAHRASGRDDLAVADLGAALEIMRGESVFQTAEVAASLGDLLAVRGEIARARELLTESLAAYEEILAPQAARVVERLAALPAA